MNPRKKKPVLFEVVARTERSKARASGPPRKPWLRLVGGNTLDAGGPVLPPSVAASPFLARWAWLVLAGAVVVIAVVTGVQVGWRSAQPPATQAGDAG